MTSVFSALHLQVLQRDWLSSNQVVFLDPQAHSASVVDTGYSSHAPQTVALLEAALRGRNLARILNTHLHSDHCGGNQALQSRWPQVRTWGQRLCSAWLPPQWSECRWVLRMRAKLRPRSAASSRATVCGAWLE